MTESPPKNKALQLMVIAILVIALDQLSKWAMLELVGIDQRPPLDITSFFRLVLVWNRGVSFGMLNDADSHTYLPWVLVAVAALISAVLARMGMKSGLLWERIGYGLVIGGALGNVIDRLRFRAVVDFLYFHAGDMGWPAFNVADASIFCGVVLLLLMMRKHPSRP